jgi:hypothetical protein
VIFVQINQPELEKQLNQVDVPSDYLCAPLAYLPATLLYLGTQSAYRWKMKIKLQVGQLVNANYCKGQFFPNLLD